MVENDLQPQIFVEKIVENQLNRPIIIINRLIILVFSYVKFAFYFSLFTAPTQSGEFIERLTIYVDLS